MEKIVSLKLIPPQCNDCITERDIRTCENLSWILKNFEVQNFNNPDDKTISYVKNSS